MDRFYQFPLPGKVLTLLGTYAVVASAVRITKKVYTSLFSGEQNEKFSLEAVKEMLLTIFRKWHPMVQAAKQQRDPRQAMSLMQRAFSESMNFETELLAKRGLTPQQFRELIAKYRGSDAAIDQVMKFLEDLFKTYIRPNPTENQHVQEAVELCLDVTSQLFEMHYNMSTAAAESLTRQHGLKIGRDPIPVDLRRDIDSEVSRTYAVARARVLQERGIPLEEFMRLHQIAEEGSEYYRTTVQQHEAVSKRRWQEFLAVNRAAQAQRPLLVSEQNAAGTASVEDDSAADDIDEADSAVSNAEAETQTSENVASEPILSTEVATPEVSEAIVSEPQLEQTEQPEVVTSSEDVVSETPDAMD